jgi:starch synthase
MKILFAASEAVPFCKTGGLADAVSALLSALKQKGEDVRLVLPKYRDVDAARHGLKALDLELTLPLGDSYEPARLWEGRLDRRVPVYFVDAPKYFDRAGLYRDSAGADYPDNDERFILFSRAVLETAKAVDFRPDAVHTHDWQTGLIPAYLATLYRFDAFFLRTAAVFTIHNIAYQGLFPKNTLFLAGFSWADFTPDRLEFYDQVNFLKAGLIFAHALTTVSPQYAREIQTPAFGRGMEGILQARAKDLFGVLNGLDTRLWNPGRDPHIAKKFSAERPDPRRLCKAALQKDAALTEAPDAPLIGMVSRLDPQKGFDLALAAIEEFLRDGAQFVVLGQGDKAVETSLRALVKRYPGQAAFESNFNEPLAHKIYSGADIFLMPSRFEPCGLGQMIALLYGAVPVVTPTGGLKDTVAPVTPDGADGLGFVAESATAPAVAAALRRAVSLYRTSPAAWKALQKRGMSSSFSWGESVEKYRELYRLALARKKGA